MAKNGNTVPSGRRARAAAKSRTNDSSQRSGHGGRAVPRTVPRGPVPVPQGSVFTLLGRTILDRLDRGVLLLDAEGRIIDANSHAVHVIRNCSGIRVRSGRLSFADPILDQQLDDALSGPSAGARNGRAVIAARVRCRGSEPYRVVIRAVPPDTDERKVAFFVLVYAPNGQKGISIEVLREVYGLTPAQAQVARSLFAGRSVDETARALDLSLNTVRTHLKQIFTKCEVNSQAELLHLLAVGPHEL
jgi:DNA-binding CsgD family transcriptional regulator